MNPRSTGTGLVLTGLAVSMAAQAAEGPDTWAGRATWAYAPLALALVLHTIPDRGGRAATAARALAFVLAAAALTMSFRHSADWAANQGFGELAWLWPLIVDGFIAYGLLLREVADLPATAAVEAPDAPLPASMSADQPERPELAVEADRPSLRAVPRPAATGSKRDAVWSMLDTDPSRTDIEIASEVGCSAKTVSRHRKTWPGPSQEAVAR